MDGVERDLRLGGQKHFSLITGIVGVHILHADMSVASEDEMV